MPHNLQRQTTLFSVILYMKNKHKKKVAAKPLYLDIAYATPILKHRPTNSSAPALPVNNQHHPRLSAVMIGWLMSENYLNSHLMHMDESIPSITENCGQWRVTVPCYTAHGGSTCLWVPVIADPKHRRGREELPLRNGGCHRLWCSLLEDPVG